MRLKSQTPPSANPVPRCTKNVWACWLLLGRTMVTMTRVPTAANAKPVQAGQQMGKAHTAFDPFCMCLLDLVLHMLQVCLLVLQCWVRSVVLRLSTCPEYSQPGSWQVSVPRPLCDAAGESFVPSSGFQTPLNVKFQNCLLDQLNTVPILPSFSQINKVYLTWKRNNNFILYYERILLLRLCKIAFSNNEVTMLWSEGLRSHLSNLQIVWQFSSLPFVTETSFICLYLFLLYKILSSLCRHEHKYLDTTGGAFRYLLRDKSFSDSLVQDGSRR